MPDLVNVGKNAMDVRKAVKCLPYSKVIVNVEQIDTDTVISYEAGDDTGITLEFDCPWGTQAMADALLQRVKGYEYQPYTVTSAIVNPAVEMGDAVQTNGVYGGIYQQDTQFGHTMYSDFSAPEDEQLDHEYTFETPVERRLTRQEAYTKANFQIQHDNIEARVVKSSGYKDAGSFSWRLEYNEFGLFSGTKQVFKCTKDGIIVDGEIKARTGYIGSDSHGFHISDKSIWNGTNSISSTTQGVYIGTDGMRVYNTSTESFTFNKNGTLEIKKGMTSLSDTSHSSGYYIGNDGIVLGGGKLKLEKDGTLTAKQGVIGSDSNAWNIGSKSIYKGKDTFSSTSSGIYLGTDGIAVGEGGDDDDGTTYSSAFSVTSSGLLHARRGKIGRNESTTWEIGDHSIYNGKDSISSDKEGIYIGTDGIAIGEGGEYIDVDGSTVKYTAGFYVSDTGDIEANSGSFRGKIVTELGSSIDGSYIEDGTVDTAQIAQDAITETELSNDAVTENKIYDEAVSESKLGSGSVSNGKIQSSAVDYDKTDGGVQSSLDNADTVTAAFDSLISGSLRANYIKADYVEGAIEAESLTVVSSGGSNLLASWQETTISGTTIKYLGRS